MNSRSIKDIDKRIAHLIKTHQNKVKAEKNFREFIESFYSNVIHYDLLETDTEYLFNLAKSCFDFAKKRTIGKPNIRISTAKAEKENTRYMTIDVIGGDMPFIVDSLTAEILRLGYTLKRMINRVIRVKRDKAGNLIEIYNNCESGQDIKFESVVHFEISLEKDKKGHKALRRKALLCT